MHVSECQSWNRVDYFGSALDEGPECVAPLRTSACAALSKAAVCASAGVSIESVPTCCCEGCQKTANVDKVFGHAQIWPRLS